MAVKLIQVTSSMICRNGYMLRLPKNLANIGPNFEEPDIYNQDSIKKFPLNAVLDMTDGRLFRYGKHGETSTTPPIARMLANKNLTPGATGGSTYGYEGSLDSTSDYAVGSTKLIMNDTTDRVENFYEDGMLAVYPTVAYHEYRIAGSEAATTVDDVTIYLDEGLSEALVVDSSGITAYPSMFSEMAYADAAGYETPLGASLVQVMTDNYFSWVQRKGRAIITPTVYFGDSANERLAMYWSDGTIATAATADPSSGYMLVGYLTQRTQSSYGDLEVWLCLE